MTTPETTAQRFIQACAGHAPDQYEQAHAIVANPPHGPAEIRHHRQHLIPLGIEAATLTFPDRSAVTIIAANNGKLVIVDGEPEDLPAAFAQDEGIPNAGGSAARYARTLVDGAKPHLAFALCRYTAARPP